MEDSALEMGSVLEADQVDQQGALAEDEYWEFSLAPDIDGVETYLGWVVLGTVWNTLDWVEAESAQAEEAAAADLTC